MSNQEHVILSLGSNLGDRLQNLRAAVERLARNGFSEIQVSPVVETAAWLKQGALSEWNRPFLNLILKCKSSLSAADGLRVCQSIEIQLGRGDHAVWSPRLIDIDLLKWNCETIQSVELTIPHPGLSIRPFVLDPWMALAPGDELDVGSCVLERRRGLTDACPVLMGIVNITPDSFSDGGERFTENALKTYFDSIATAPPSIIDLGGQSTRPGAEVVGEEEEWRRLERALEQVAALHQNRVRPWISIDTFRASLARRAIEWGVEMINDVSGFDDPAMIELAASANAHFVFMHHLGVPVKRGVTMPLDCDPVAEILNWADAKLNHLVKAGVSIHRLIFDPGVGFGKTPQQSQAIVDRAAEFKHLPVRVLVGHSRKSFQKTSVLNDVFRRYSHLDPLDIDAITIQQSLELAAHGVEFLRVHNVPDHRETFLRYFSSENNGSSSQENNGSSSKENNVSSSKENNGSHSRETADLSTKQVCR